MKKCAILVILAGAIVYSQSLENSIDRSNSSNIICPENGIFVGIQFKGHKDINFTTEKSEENGWNELILTSLQKVTKKANFAFISPDELQKYFECKCIVAIVTMTAYRETYVGGGETKGSIEIIINVYETPSSEKPSKSYLLKGTGDSDYGHSNPLEYAIREACILFEDNELGLNMFRLGFGPAIGWNSFNKLNLISPNFAICGTFGKHFVTIPLSAGISINADTTMTDIYRKRRSAAFIGGGIDYLYAIYQNKYLSVGPSAIIGYWRVKEMIIHEIQDTNIVYTSGVSGPGFFDRDSVEYIRKHYFAAPGFELWGGIGKFQGKLEGRIALGINSPLMWSLRLGVLFMKR